MAGKIDIDINELVEGIVEDGVDLFSVMEQVIHAMDIGGNVSEFITEFVALAQKHDLESTLAPMAIMTDAYHEVRDRFEK